MKFSLIPACLALMLLTLSPLHAATVDATWSSAGDVPVTAVGYDATGNTIDLTLNFTPLAATNLTVVNNTGLDFITGAFSNLAQGQAVALTFRRITYHFVANYYGGSGNDLVLQWANVRPMAWGRNSDGQLGDSGTTQSNVPTAVLRNSGVLSGRTVIAVAAGGSHSLALCSDGTLAAWGENASGQLGINSRFDKTMPTAVVQNGVLAGKTVVAIAAGSLHSLALCSDGTLVVWGGNFHGQLGRSGIPDSLVPVEVWRTDGALAGKKVIAVAGGGNHSLALCSDGTLAAWGYNRYGQLGNGGTADSTTPTAVQQNSGVLAGKSVIAIRAGASHNLALCADGTLAAWGSNSSGQLGNNTSNDSFVPVAVQQSSGLLSGRTVIAIAAGGNHNLALCADNTLASWGSNGSGQLGNDTFMKSTVPVAVQQGSGALFSKTVIAVATGGAHSLAVCAEGTVAAWGQNFYGQLGNNSTTESQLPLAVSISPLASGEQLHSFGFGSSAFHTLSLAAAHPPLEATVSGNNADIADGDSTPASINFTDMGGIATAGGTLVRTFTITNSGTIPLTLGSVTVSGADAGDFSVTAQPAANVDIGGSTNFQVTFNPSEHGLRSAGLSFNYNDLEANPFDFSIQGTGLNSAPTAMALSSNTIVENNAPNATVGDLSFTDPDPGDVPAYSLVSGTGSADNSSFSIEGNTLKLILSANFEIKSGYNIRVRVDDGLGGTFERAFFIGIIDALEVPSLNTPTSASITATEAVLGGRVSFDGGSAILERGVVYSATGTNADPAIDGAGVTKVVADGTTGTFTVSVTGLLPNTAYSFKAYATNAQGTSYTNLAGFGTAITSTYTTATDVPVTAASYTAAGSTVTLALGFMPQTGTDLTVVNNTGLDFIKGAFSNLAQGQVVALTYEGLKYQFVANYYGGSGNDLVLQWAYVRPMAWGRNSSGQLGIGSTTNSTLPGGVRSSGVLADKTVIAVAAGALHSLARCSDGTVAAWGWNLYGQLGTGSNGQSVYTAPVAVRQSSGVLFGKTVIAVAAGLEHSLALCSDGTVAAWGHNSDGQLGNNSTTDSSAPVAVKQSPGVLAGKTVVAVAAGQDHSLALCSDGTLAAWGENGSGQLGNNSTTDSNVPVAVVQDSGVLAGKIVIAIAAGSSFNLALCADGTVAAWGANASGQLGNNSTTQSSVPVAVVQTNGVLLGKTVIAIKAGNSHSLALCADGTLAAWGRNADGQLGDNSTTSSNVPVAVQQSNPALSGKTVTAIGAGGNHSLALASNGTLAAWGRNADGQLGNNTTTQSTVPVGVNTSTLAPAEIFTAASSGKSADHTLAIAAAPLPPEITVSGNNVAIADGDSTPGSSDFTDFGSAAGASGTVVRTFTISNSGISNAETHALTLENVTVSGPGAADFTVTAQPAVHVGAAGSTTFEVTFDPSANGLRSAVLSFIYNGYRDENPFNFSIQGTGLNTVPVAIDLSATSIVENNAPDATVGTLSATDADLGDVHTFSFVSGDGSSDNNSFTIAGNALRLTSSADFETKNFYLIRIGVDDGQGGTFEKPFVITIINELDVPTVAGPAVGGISATAAEFGGNVTFDGGTPVTGRGVVYAPTSVNATPEVGGAGVITVPADGTMGAFTIPVTDLSPNTDYSVRAYATNAQGTCYTSVTRFNTGFTFSYTGAANAPITAANFAAGGAITLALGYAPVTGTNLMVVNNIGLDFIQGTFSNLAQGQAVTLSFNGVLYRFVANYFGGSGNDLVLQWANVRPVAWGANGYGQLGNGVVSQSNLPTRVPQSGVLSGKTILRMATGAAHSLALCADGTLAAWGHNTHGQLGNNSRTHSSEPVAVLQSSGVLSGKTVVAITAGYYHSLALCSDGTVAAWGYNTNGQLGNSSTTRSTVPVAVLQSSGVLTGKTVVAVAAGDYHNLALCSDGTLAAWGYNINGQLGNSSTTQSSVPVAVLQSSSVLSGKTIIAAAAGASHSLALCSDGTLTAWGGNSYGQLGNSSTTQSSVPVAVRQSAGVLSGKTVIAVAAGTSHSLALCSDGTPAAWGYNGEGQLGNNSTTQSTIPVAVRQSSGALLGKTVIAVTAGDSHSLAQCADGTLAAWGYNGGGQLSTGYTTSSSVPITSTTQLQPGERLATVRTGSSANHTLALVALPPVPVIMVSGNGVDIAPGDSMPSSSDFTDFGDVGLANTQVTRTFTIRNAGDVPLNLTGNPRVRISGDAAADFQVTTLPAAILSPGATTDFAITFDPSLPGLRSARVLITNDAPIEGTFIFALQGFGKLSTPLAQTITFAAPATVYLGQSPLALAASASSGLPVSLALVSAPAGTTLEEGLLTLTGTGTVKVQATQPGGGNYAAAKAVTVSLAVKANPAALTLTGLNQMYDGTPKAIGTEGGMGEVQVTYTVNRTSTATPPTNAGSYTVKAVAGTVTKTGKLVIAKAPLYVTPSDLRKFAGQANPPFGVTYSGFMGPDGESVMTKLPVLSTTAKTTSPGGAYPIKASGGSAANYAFVYRQGTLMVESFAGSYEALLTNGAGLPVGKLALTVPLAGQSFTGKLYTAEESAAVSLAGSLTTDADNARAEGRGTTVVKGVPYVVDMTLPLYGDVVATATRNGAPLGAASDGRKLLALPTGGKVRYAGVHTVVLEPATPGGSTVPAGAGWATATVSSTGVIKLAGKLGDGTAFTSDLAPDGGSDPGYRLFVQPYLPARTGSYLGGQFRLKAHPSVSLPDRRYLEAANMTWVKAGRTGDASYRAGFSPVTTVLTLDPWQVPSTAKPLGMLLGLGGSSFSVIHGTTGSLAHDGGLPTSAALSATNMVSVLLPAANTTKWKVTLAPKTGTFTGSFELRDGTSAAKRPVPFTGVLRQPLTTPALPGTVIGDGHYLMPPLIGTEKVSGGVSFAKP